jgi:hypothetical protein
VIQEASMANLNVIGIDPEIFGATRSMGVFGVQVDGDKL